MVGVALACAVAIAAPFALHGGDHPAASPVSPTADAPPPVASALGTGDLDGDGTPDVVRLSHGRLRVDLGSGSSVRRLLPGDPTLEGLARVDDAGLAIVTSARAHDGTVGRHWTVWRLMDGDVVGVPFAGGRALTSRSGLDTAWVGADGRLHDGTLDPLQDGADRVAVLARTWTLHDGRLASEATGVWCWDRSAPATPEPCAFGQDWRYDVGPRGDLPALLPEAGRHGAGAAGVRTDGEVWTLRRDDASTSVEAARYHLVVTGQGVTQTAAVPAGWSPVLFRRAARIGDLTDGVLVSQEGGDSDAWRVFVRWAGEVQPLRTRGPVRLGGGFTADGASAYLSWMADDGRLYTRIGTARPDRFHVYAWVPGDATASQAPVLQARDLGVVCLDQTWDTYGTCAH